MAKVYQILDYDQDVVYSTLDEESCNRKLEELKAKELEEEFNEDSEIEERYANYCSVNGCANCPYQMVNDRTHPEDIRYRRYCLNNIADDDQRLKCNFDYEYHIESYELED